MRGQNGETALMHATRSGSLGVVRDLLERGADSSIRNNVRTNNSLHKWPE